MRPIFLLRWVYAVVVCWFFVFFFLFFPLLLLLFIYFEWFCTDTEQIRCKQRICKLPLVPNHPLVWHMDLGPYYVLTFYFLNVRFWLFISKFAIFIAVVQKIQFRDNTRAIVWFLWIIFDSSTKGGAQAYVWEFLCCYENEIWLG